MPVVHGSRADESTVTGRFQDGPEALVHINRVRIANFQRGQRARHDARGMIDQPSAPCFPSAAAPGSTTDPMAQLCDSRGLAPPGRDPRGSPLYPPGMADSIGRGAQA